MMDHIVKREQFSLEDKQIIISEVDKGLKRSEVAKKCGISRSTLSTFLKDRESIVKQLRTSVLGPSKKRKQFSLEDKQIIISEVDKGLKKGEVAKKYGISPSTLSTFLKDRETIVKQLQTSGLSSSRKRMRKARFEAVDAAVFKWFQDARSRNIPLTGPIIREKALEFAKRLDAENFHGSVGWLNRFRERYSVVDKYISGEDSDKPTESVKKCQEEMEELIKKYSPNDVFNADETAVFYQLEPRETLALKEEKCVGGKVSQQRITALFCCNKSGTEKRKVLIIGKSAKPRSIKHCKSLPCIYKCNKKAWMTQAIFNDWLIDFDKEMKEERRKILLLIDHCSPHNNPPKLENIHVEHFTPNCTAQLQPLYQGIITAVKSRYRTFLSHQMLHDLEENTQRKCNLKKAIEWLCGAWDEISPTTISNCWKHVNTTKDDNSEEADLEDEVLYVQNSELVQLWIAIKEKTLIPDELSLVHYVSADKYVSTCNDLADEDIVQSIKDCKDEGNDSSTDEEVEDNAEDEDNYACKVSSSEALASLETLRTYISSQSNVPGVIFSYLHQLENYLLTKSTSNLLLKMI